MSLGSLRFLKPTARTAASDLLDRVVAEERDRLTARVCLARLGVAALNFLFVFPSDDGTALGYSSTLPSRMGALAYLVMAAALFGVVRRWPSSRRGASFAPAFLDVPLVGAFELLQAQYAEVPGLGAPASVAYLIVLAMMSMLALSRTVLLVVSVPTVGFVWAILAATRTAVEIRLGVMVALVGAFALGWIIIGQMRALVRLSRQADLLGKYVLGQRLGAGGMAEVFLATYSPEGGFERKVALKRMLPAFSENPEIITLFRREASVGARLTHPNIVQVYDFGVHEGRYFLAMEYVDGAALSRVVRALQGEGLKPSIPALVYLAHEVAAALDWVSQQRDEAGEPLGLVHRDLNPPNLLVSRAGEVKVADFGIARVGNQPGLTQTGVMRGKLPYAAPEQLETSNRLDVRADLFALGLTLLEVASGKRVFEAETEFELARKVLEAPIPRLSELVSGVPPGLDDAVAQLTRRSLNDRTPTPRTLLDQVLPLARELNAFEAGRKEWAMAVALVQTSTHLLIPPVDPGPARETETKTSPVQIKP